MLKSNCDKNSACDEMFTCMGFYTHTHGLHTAKCVNEPKPAFQITDKIADKITKRTIIY